MAQMQGFCWPLSAAQGESIEFKIATTSPRYQLTFVRFENLEAAEVTAEIIRNSQELDEFAMSPTIELQGQTQMAAIDPTNLSCENWDFSYRLEIPESWESNYYAAKCEEIEDPDGERSTGEAFYIVFIVNPPYDERGGLLYLANVTAWNAYNTYGGRSRYTTIEVADYDLSYLRPNPHTINLTIPDDSDSPLIQLRYPVAETTRHLARAEMWVLSWLQKSGYECDVFTDLDWHAGIEGIEQYSTVIMSTHPEYWSIQMFENLKDYLNQGGNLLYLGGNGIFDVVEISEDFTTITVHGTVDKRTKLFRDPLVGMPESEILGIAYNINDDNRFPYIVKDTSNRFMEGLTNGEEIGTRGWCIPVGGLDLIQGAASGWETDQVSDNSPEITVLAEGGGEHGAQMIYYDHPGGGFVFSVGSITFGGSLVVDEKLQQILGKILDEVTE